MIEWKHLGQPRFDEIVEALIKRIYAGADEIWPVDGRGGDGGRDIVVTQGNRKRIFQLKYFPEGFPAENRSRRRQIINSFKKAMDHNPYEWVLVVPANLTPGEVEFIKNLGEGRPVKIRWLDRGDLNERMATFPDLDRYFQRDHLREAVRDFHAETATLTNGLPDLAQRMLRLKETADTLDPDWTVEPSMSQGEVVLALTAKHPLAARDSPITVSIQSTLGDQSELLAGIRRSLGFGTSETIKLSADLVSSFKVDGPEWIRTQTDTAEVMWMPAGESPLKGASVEIRFLDADGSIVGSHEGSADHVGGAIEGFSLEVSFYRQMKMTILLPHDQTAGCDLSYSFNVRGIQPMDAFAILELNSQLRTCLRAGIYVNGSELAQFRLGNDEPYVEEEELQAARLIAEDLAQIQHHTKTRFPIPNEMTAEDRVGLRVASLLLGGKCCIYPGAAVTTATLSVDGSPELEGMLKQDAFMIRFDYEDFSVSLGHRVLKLGTVIVFHPSVRLENAASIKRMLAKKTAKGTKLKFVPTDGGYFRAYMPDKWTDADSPLAPTPLNLPGIPEPGSSDCNEAR
ncbi:hypothetical protein ACSBOX_05890 [Arthrobacter sp. KN11-1C]|uniref:hypothetical protein n=1 Tax=Arthrobacter sp. KN11-1C TaxID=3445774 RepID=UPI003F9EDCF1